MLFRCGAVYINSFGREGYAGQREPVLPVSDSLSATDDAEITVACPRDLERQKAGDALAWCSTSAGRNGESRENSSGVDDNTKTKRGDHAEESKHPR